MMMLRQICNLLGSPYALLVTYHCSGSFRPPPKGTNLVLLLLEPWIPVIPSPMRSVGRMS